MTINDWGMWQRKSRNVSYIQNIFLFVAAVGCKKILPPGGAKIEGDETKQTITCSNGHVIKLQCVQGEWEPPERDISCWGKCEPPERDISCWGKWEPPERDISCWGKWEPPERNISSIP